MEPGTQRVAHPEAAGLLDQHEEGRLEGVLRVMGVVQLCATDPQDHRAVALDQHRESQLGGLAVSPCESFQ